MDEELQRVEHELCAYRNGTDHGYDTPAFRALAERVRRLSRTINRACIRVHEDSTLRDLSFIVEIIAENAIRAIPLTHRFDRKAYELEGLTIALRHALQDSQK